MLYLLNFLWGHVFLKRILMRIFQFIHMTGVLLLRMENLAVNIRLILYFV